MAWYWWVLIAAGLVVFVFIKIKASNAWMKRQKEKREQREKAMEDDD